MTVFYFTNLSFPDGAMASGNRVVHLARCLIGKGVKVVVFSPFADSGCAGRFENGGIEFRACCNGHKSGIRSQLMSSFLYPLRAYWQMRKLRDDETVIYSYTGNLVHEIWACLFSKWLKLPICREGCEFPYTILSHAPKSMQWLETKFCMRFYAGVIAITKELENYYRKVTRPGCRVLRIPMTVDCDRFNGDFTSPFDFEYIAYTGAMNRKGGGVDVLVRAFGILAEKHPSLHLVLIGKGSDKLRSDLLAMVLGDVRGRIHCLFTGAIPTDEMPCYIKNAKVLAMLPLPTVQQEGCFPTKLGEYLSSGVPAVVSKVGIPARLLADREQVYFVPPDDSETTASVVDEIIANYEQAKEVAVCGRALARGSFHYAQFADTLYGWYREILG